MMPFRTPTTPRYRAEQRDEGWFVQQQVPGARADPASWHDVLGPVTQQVAEQEVWLRQQLVGLIRTEHDRRDVG